MICVSGKTWLPGVVRVNGAGKEGSELRNGPKGFRSRGDFPTSDFFRHREGLPIATVTVAQQPVSFVIPDYLLAFGIEAEGTA
jgi:hypothetical protein